MISKITELKPVAPCMGAWIETFNVCNKGLENNVAPCMGAWIETVVVTVCIIKTICRTLYGCVD